MPEYHSGRSHSSGFSKFSKIEVGRYSPNRIRKKADKPELSEEEELQKIREEFGKRIALSEQQDAATSARKHERLEQKQSKSQDTPILSEEAAVPSHGRQGGEARVYDPPTFSSGTANPQRGLPQGSPEQSITASVAVAKQAYQQKDYANTYELFTQIVNKQPDNYEALFHLGVSATETGNHNVAIETTKKLIDSGHFTAQAL